MREESQRWLDKAEDDLKKARDNCNIIHYDLASFLCQQAAERAFKAVLIEETKRFPKIHDLVKLGRLVNASKDMLKECEKLTFVYVETRYPDVSNRSYTKQESLGDIEIAEKVLRWAKERLS